MVGGDTDDGVIAGKVDLTVVEKKAVDERGQPEHRGGVVVLDRLVGEIAGGHHERRHRPAVGGVVIAKRGEEEREGQRVFCERFLRLASVFQHI